ncbi:MAG: tetratricopeptide repeat protein [candidate division KSB1 bacterium]|nr:tetratricopeptide repeat protein [candidate division KSB1 bacterium]
MKRHTIYFVIVGLLQLNFVTPLSPGLCNRAEDRDLQELTQQIQQTMPSAMIASLLFRADSLLRKDGFDAARKTYQSILKMEPSSTEARIGLGKVALAQERWDEANEFFQQVLSSDPENKEAHYYCAICYRETGKFKVLLLRKLDWDKSKRHFEWILSRDSLYKDVVYQWAVLHRYQEKYQAAVQLGHAQIRLRPELVEPQVKLFRFYRYLISHLDAKEAIDWLKQQPWDHARFAIGELHRRMGRLASADSIFRHLLETPLVMSRQPIYLSLARIYYQKNQPELAQRHYWQSVDEIQNDIDAELVFEDLKYILSDPELEQFRSLVETQEKIEFFRALWVQRDPTPAATINYRLAEHYRRLLYAEQHFEFDGFRTWFNNPDKLGYLNFPRVYQLNHEFHDKGLIYIRHGQYDDWAVTVGQDVPDNESWLYYPTATTPRMVFHFVMENTVGYWRFTPIITDPHLLEDRLQFGNIYYRLLQSDPLEQQTLMNEMAKESQRAVFTGLSTDQHRWDKAIKPLNLAFMFSSFRGASGKTVVEIYNAFSLWPLIDPSKTEPQQVELEKGIALHNCLWQEIERRHETSSISVTRNEFYIDLYRLEVPADSYHVAFFLRPHHHDFLGGWKVDTRIPDYSSNVLALSDIQLATIIAPADQPGRFVKHGLLVVPNPTRRFDKTKPVYVYFETYNLTPNSEGKTFFSIDYKLTMKKQLKRGIAGLFGGQAKSSIATRIEREGTNEMSVEYLAIDVSQLKSGEYELEVKVTDRHTQRSVQKTRPILLDLH